MNIEENYIPVDHSRKQPMLKLVISGNIYEWYEFEVPIRTKRGDRENVNTKTEEERLNNYKSSDDVDKNFRKVKKEIERLINCNPNLIKFLTLTFRDHITNISEANKLFHNFIGRLRKEFPGVQYICIPEFTKKGRVHYHLLCHLPYIPSKKIETIWANGFIKIKRTDRVKNMAKYLTKYLSKGLFDERLFKKKKYFCSQELIRPTILRDEDALNELLQTPNLKKLYTTKVEIKFIGTMLYELYEQTTASNDLQSK